MSLTQNLMALFCIVLLGSSQANAACERGPAKTVRLNMDMGRVVLNPDLPIGSVIAEKRFTLNVGDMNNYFYYCEGYNDFIGDLDSSIKGSDGGKKVYPTNIPGIGMTFSMSSSDRNGANFIYYGSQNRYSGLGEYYFFRNQIFYLKIIKTAAQTGSGTLKEGRYTFYNSSRNGGNNPMLETWFTGSSVTIVSPSCTVTSGKEMNVDVGSVNRLALGRTGSTAGGKDFNITLRCSGGVTAEGYANINATFSGTRATNTTVRDGVLINEKTGDTMAEGVGIQVLHNNVPIVFNQKYLMGTAPGEQMTDITYPLTARFYRYGSTLTAGEVQSHMIFNLTYD